MVSVGLTTVSVNAFDAMALRLSFTVMVKLDVPAAVGTPLRTPAVLKPMPAGSVPPLMLHNV